MEYYDQARKECMASLAVIRTKSTSRGRRGVFQFSNTSGGPTQAGGKEPTSTSTRKKQPKKQDADSSPTFDLANF